MKEHFQQISEKEAILRQQDHTAQVPSLPEIEQKTNQAIGLLVLGLCHLAQVKEDIQNLRTALVGQPIPENTLFTFTQPQKQLVYQAESAESQKPRFGELLRQFRKDASLTQMELAKRSGTCNTNISAYEQSRQGTKDGVTTRVITALATGLGLAEDDPKRLQLLEYKRKGRINKISGEIIESPTKIAVLEFAQRFQADHPGETLIFQLVANHVGVSRERVRQIYKQLLKEYPDLPKQKPHIATNSSEAAVLDEQVKNLSLQGLHLAEISTQLEKSYKTVYSSCKRLVAAGEISKVLKKGRRRNKQRYEQVIALRKQGVGQAKIGEILGLGRGSIVAIIKKLTEEGQIRRLRKKPRTKDEAYAFREQIKMIHQQGKTNREIADALDVSLSEVVGAVKLLLDRGEVSRRKDKRKKRNQQILELRLQGLPNKQIADKLRISVLSVERIVGNLIKQGFIEKRKK